MMFKDCLKQSLINAQIVFEDLENAALDFGSWKDTMKTDARTFEDQQLKRVLRKDKNAELLAYVGNECDFPSSM